MEQNCDVRGKMHTFLWLLWLLRIAEKCAHHGACGARTILIAKKVSMSQVTNRVSRGRDQKHNPDVRGCIIDYRIVLCPCDLTIQVSTER